MMTPRQLQAFELYVQGKTFRQIGDALGITYVSAIQLVGHKNTQAAIAEYRSAKIRKVFERAAADLPEMLKMEAEIARASADPKADAVRLKAIQGRVARCIALAAPPALPTTPEEDTTPTDETLVAGLQRIKDTRPDLLTAAGLAPTDPPE